MTETSGSVATESGTGSPQDTIAVLRMAAEVLGGDGWNDEGRVNVKTAAEKWKDPPAGAERGRRAPRGWKQYWSATKQKPYYQHKASRRVVWELPPTAWSEGEPDAREPLPQAQGTPIQSHAALHVLTPHATPVTPAPLDSQGQRRTPAHDPECARASSVEPAHAQSTKTPSHLHPLIQGNDLGSAIEAQRYAPDFENVHTPSEAAARFCLEAADAHDASSILGAFQGELGPAEREQCGINHGTADPPEPAAHDDHDVKYYDGREEMLPPLPYAGTDMESAVNMLRDQWQTIKSKPPRFPTAMPESPDEEKEHVELYSADIDLEEEASRQEQEGYCRVIASKAIRDVEAATEARPSCMRPSGEQAPRKDFSLASSEAVGRIRLCLSQAA